MKCSILLIGPPSASITSRHLFSILLIKVCMRHWSRLAHAGHLQNALGFLQRGIVLHLLVGFPLDVIPEVLDGVAFGRSCRPFHMLNAIFLQKLIGDSSTMRSCIVVHKDKLVSDGCCIRHDVRLQHLVNIVGRSIDLEEMALSVWNGLQDPPTATASRTSGITSSGKPTRRWRTIPLWRNSSAFCRGPEPTWINVAYKLWSTVCWRGVARWSKQMVDLSIIEHFIRCDVY